MMALRKKSTHPLAHLIPDPELGPVEDGGIYVSRTINKVKDMDLLKYAHKSGQNVLMEGDTGPGKSSMVWAYCVKYQYPLVTIMGNGGIDPNAFWVVPLPDPEMGFRMQEADILTAIREGNCVIYFDEINFTPPKVLSPWNSFLGRQRIVTIMELGNEMVKAGPNILFITTYNPGYEGTRPLNQALRNRFSIKLWIDYDPKVEDALLCMPVMRPIADRLRAQRPAEIQTPVSTNMLIEFEQIALDVSLDFAISNFMAAFGPTEREAVGGVFEMYRHELELQVKKMDAGEAPEEDEVAE